MILRNLKSFLICNLNERRPNAIAVNEEVLESVMPGFSLEQLDGKEIMVYQFEETMIFMSDGGLMKPRQIIFLDLASGASFLQQIED